MREVEDKILKTLTKSKKSLSIDDILNKIDNITKKELIKILKKLVENNKVKREIIKRKAHYSIKKEDSKKEANDIKLVTKKDIINWEKEVIEIEKIREESVLKLEEELNNLYEKKYNKLELQYNNSIKKLDSNIENMKNEMEKLVLELNALKIFRIFKKRKLKQQLENYSMNVLNNNDLKEEMKIDFKLSKENLSHNYKSSKSDMLEKEYRKYLVPENPVIIEEDYKKTLDKINNYTSTYYDTVDITIKCELENIIIKRKILDTLKNINKYVTIQELQTIEKELLKYTNQRIKSLLKSLVDEGKILKEHDNKVISYKYNSKFKNINKLLDYDNNCLFSKDRNEVYLVIKKHVKNNYIELNKIIDSMDMSKLRILQVLYSLEQEKKIIKKCEPNRVVYFVSGGI